MGGDEAGHVWGKMRQDMYGGTLSLTLVRENARAILARSSWPAS